MSTPVTFNGVGYTIPETDEVNWGDEVTNWIVAVSNGTIQQDGGTFTLTADIVLADFGLQSDYIITPSIQSASGVDIEITPGGTGNVALGNFSFDADQSVGAGQDNYVLTYNNSTGLISLETVVLALGELSDVTVSAPATGDSLVYTGAGWQNDSEYRPVENGFENRTDSEISFVDGTRTFTIEPAVDEFSFWSGGAKYTKSSSEDIVISDTEGLHWIYYNGSTLSETTTFTTAIIQDYAYVAAIYWDADNDEGIIVHEERHGRTMDSGTHTWAHYGLHTLYKDGLGLGSIVSDSSGDDDADAQLSVADGSILDEDITHTIVDGSPQTLSAIAQIPLYYRSGASGVWRKLAATNFPVTTTGSGRAAWNENTGATWQLSEVASTEYVLTHLFATGDILNPVIGVVGQATYSTLNNAQSGATYEVNALLFGGLEDLVTEFKAIATVIYQTAAGYTNSVKSRIRSTSNGDDYVDWRFIASGGATGGISVSDHGSLTGLGDDDHTQYALADGTRTFTGPIAIEGSNPEVVLNHTSGFTHSYLRFKESGTQQAAIGDTGSGGITIFLDVAGTPKQVYLNSDGSVSSSLGASYAALVTADGDLTDKKYVDDAITAAAGLSDVVDDLSPQLGGSLDVNGQSIVSISNGDITLTPDGTGNVILGSFEFDADQSVGAGQDNYVLTYNNSTGLISLETIPSSTTFKAASGSAATPSYSFSSDTDTGMFLSGSPGLEFSVSSHLVLDLREDDIRPMKPILMGLGGDETAPVYSFASDPDTGIFYPTTNSIGFTTAGTERVRIEADGTMRVYATNYETLVTGDDDIPNKKYVDDVAAAIGFPQFIELTDAPSSYASGSANKLVAVNSGEDGVEFVERTLMADGAVGAPAYSFESAATSGIYYYSGSVRIAWGGTACLSIDTSNVDVSSSNFNFPAGAEATPGCRVYGDPNTGIYWPGADTLAFSTGGVGRFQIESNGTLGVLTTDYETLVTADDDIPNKKYVDDAVAGGVSQLSDLDDVFDATATNGYVLVAGGLTWQSQALTESLISDLGSYIESVNDDSAPTLAGDLVVNGFAIKSLSNGDIAITPNGTGDLILDGLKWPQADGSADQVLKTNGSGQLSWVDPPGLIDVVSDLSPQLGGSLDVNGQSIVSVSNGDITLTPNGTGKTKVTALEAPLSQQTQTGTTYTCVLGDADKMVTMNNASANTVTIPANASVAYPVGTKLNFMQLGAGQTTVAITSDTLNVEAGLTLKLKGQYAVATAFKVTSTTWVLFGNLEPA